MVRENPVIAYRIWDTSESPSPKRLRSLIRLSHIWKPREALRSTCDRTTESGMLAHGHEKVGSTCTCGVYAIKGLETGPVLSHPHAIFGAVALWGEIASHSIGYRAECAYPQWLYLMTEDSEAAKAYNSIVKNLANIYGVEAIPFKPTFSE